MKTYKDFVKEATEDFPGRKEIVKKYNTITQAIWPTPMIKYLNGKIKKASVDAEKLLAPTRMLKIGKGAHERFNNAAITGVYPSLNKLNIEPMKNGMFRIQIIATANFRSASYVGSQTWYPYGVFMTLIVDEDLNVKKIERQHFTNDNAIRRSAKFRGTGPLKKVIYAAYDLIAKEAISDLQYDTKTALADFEKFKT